MRLIGLRNITCTVDYWYHLLFYDIDRQATQEELDTIDYIMQKHHISYLIYNTKHGCHVIGLTPMKPDKWGIVFMELQNLFHSYYAGQTIRLSRKEGEQQNLIKLEEHFGEVIPNLYNLYAGKFGLIKKQWTRETSKYLLVFEKYRSMKE